MTELIFLDPRVERMLSKMVFRPMQNEQLWNPLLLPMEKFFLICGQKGCGMFRAVVNAIGIFDYHVIDVASDTCEDEFEALNVFKPFLLMKHIHLIYKRPRLLKRLKHGRKSHYVIGFSNASINELGEHWYWEQFKTKVGYGVPDAETRHRMMRFWFEEWKKHAAASGIGGEVNLSEEDYRWLGEECAGYCTPRDIKHFAQRIFTHVLNEYPEKTVIINRKFLIEERFLLEPFGIPESYCITARDTQHEQSKFTPEMVNALTQQQVDEMKNASKRRRTETAFDIQ